MKFNQISQQNHKISSKLGVKFEGAFLSIVRTGGGGLGWPQGVDAVKHWKEVDEKIVIWST